MKNPYSSVPARFILAFLIVMGFFSGNFVNRVSAAPDGSTTLLSSNILDDFNREDGSLGPNWNSGADTNITSHEVLIDDTFDLSTNAIWNVESFGADQEVFMTIKAVNVTDPGTSVSLILKKQQPDASNSDMILVVYRHAQAHVQVYVIENGSFADAKPPQPASFANGDQFGVSVNGSTLYIYKNGAQILTQDVSSYDYINNPGYVGFRYYLGGTDTEAIDDFGGGTITGVPTLTPSAMPPTTDPLTPSSTPSSTPPSTTCTDPTSCNPVRSITALWRCNSAECTSSEWQGSVIAWPSWSAYTSNTRTGDNSRSVFNTSAEPLYPYMGPWADGCTVTALTPGVLIIEWERGTDTWRETLLNPGQTHTIDLVPPENSAMIESNGINSFTVSLSNCNPQNILGTPTSTVIPSATPTQTFTALPTDTATFTSTATLTPLPTITDTATSTSTLTNTPSFTPTWTPTNTPTYTATSTLTKTNTPTFTPSYTPTYTATSTLTKTNTPTFTPSYTPTKTATPTATNTNTPTFTPSYTPTKTATPTATNTNTPTRTPTAVPNTLKVQYRTGNTTTGDNQIFPHFNVINTGTGSVPLSELKIRYWYTREGTTGQNFFCDYSAIPGNCSNISGTFVQLSPTRTGADFYLEVGFSSAAGTIAAGGQSGEIQLRFAKTDWSNYNEIGDYSFDVSKTTYADWNRVTLYRNGTLIWGVEPTASTATNTPTQTPTATATPSYSYQPLYLSLANAQTIGGVAAASEDVLKFDGRNWSMFFDGSDVGVGGVNLTAFTMLDPDSILMSFSSTVSVGGLSVSPQDVVRFDATSLGTTTAGTFSMYFDGSDVGLSTATESIDAIDRLPDGRLLLSTTGDVIVAAGSAYDEDVIAFTPSSLGSSTSGTFSMYFDGSDVGLSTSDTEDVDALDVTSNGNIYLSTNGDFAVSGVSGADEDVFTCVPSSVGNTTACTYSPTLYFDGSTWALAANDVDAFNFLTVP